MAYPQNSSHMRLLLFTQAIDTQDQLIGGFMHHWVEELAKHFESIEIICLKEGHHALPKNVQVYSLGKEAGENRIKYIARFYKYVWKLKGRYDRVFVHMNPHYVLLGGWYWKLKRIPVFFWRNHARMNWMTQVAARFAKKVFYTSPYACTSRFHHAVQMPVGIDTEFFTPQSGDKTTGTRIVFLGRLSPVKHVDQFVSCVPYLPHEYEVHIYGDAPPQDALYAQKVKAEASARVTFFGGVPHEQTPEVYRAYDLYMNLTPRGSMDKTVLEAAACGIPVLVRNDSFKDVLPEEHILTTSDPKHLAAAIIKILSYTQDVRDQIVKEVRERIVEKHSLEKLCIMLRHHMT